MSHIDRGPGPVDFAVLLAQRGEAIADFDVLSHENEVLGPVALTPTVWRALVELTPTSLRRIEQARALIRHHVWARLTTDGGVPASRAAADLDETMVLNVDATLVTVHSRTSRRRPRSKTDSRTTRSGWAATAQGDAGRDAAGGERRLQHHQRRTGVGCHPFVPAKRLGPGPMSPGRHSATASQRLSVRLFPRAA